MFDPPAHARVTDLIWRKYVTSKNKMRGKQKSWLGLQSN
jgi:hypothetical protein